MNYILVEQDERLQLLISIVKRIKSNTVVVFSENQINFLQELFILMGIKTNFRTYQQPANQSLQIYYDPPLTEVKSGLVFVLPEEKIPNCTESKLEKNKQEQFATQEVMKLVSSNYNLNCLAEKAYKDFVYTYQHKLDQQNYDVLKLNPMRLCKSFGFEVTPKLNNFRLRPSKEYPQKQTKTNQTKSKKIKKQSKIVNKKVNTKKHKN
ncbi:unnamed protein product [Paramecium octaurelia]|uniref:ATP-dependent rRNA helicase SPB4-like C-terminal extension domain-containing protein n=1 Tax=Paramecium octaurelia TaxID=43137 RepID=A0A8S1VZV0_PAROT|nr:unnamed protein product [Paramecium octaurelia]